MVVPVFATTPGHVLLLVRTLEHLQKQTRSPDYVVLVDDGGPLPLPLSFAGMEQVHLSASGAGLAYTVHRHDTHPTEAPVAGYQASLVLVIYLGCLGTAPLLMSCSNIVPCCTACIYSSATLFPCACSRCCSHCAFVIGPAQCRVRSPRLAALHATLVVFRLTALHAASAAGHVAHGNCSAHDPCRTCLFLSPGVPPLLAQLALL